MSSPCWDYSNNMISESSLLFEINYPPSALSSQKRDGSSGDLSRPFRLYSLQVSSAMVDASRSQPKYPRMNGREERSKFEYLRPMQGVRIRGWNSVLKEREQTFFVDTFGVIADIKWLLMLVTVNWLRLDMVKRAQAISREFAIALFPGISIHNLDPEERFGAQGRKLIVPILKHRSREQAQEARRKQPAWKWRSVKKIVLYLKASPRLDFDVLPWGSTRTAFWSKMRVRTLKDETMNISRRRTIIFLPRRIKGSQRE